MYRNLAFVTTKCNYLFGLYAQYVQYLTSFIDYSRELTIKGTCQLQLQGLPLNSGINSISESFSIPIKKVQFLIRSSGVLI